MAIEVKSIMNAQIAMSKPVELDALFLSLNKVLARHLLSQNLLLLNLRILSHSLNPERTEFVGVNICKLVHVV